MSEQAPENGQRRVWNPTEIAVSAAIEAHRKLSKAPTFSEAILLARAMSAVSQAVSAERLAAAVEMLAGAFTQPPDSSPLSVVRTQLTD